MAKITQIYTSRQPRRPHFIAEWMEKREITAADLLRDCGIDKSLVSRWLKGSTPSEESQIKLAAIFHTSREGLFRHPSDDWMARLFSKRAELKRLLMERTEPELDRIQKMQGPYCFHGFPRLPSSF